MSKCYALCRVSTEDQSNDQQRDEILRACPIFGLGEPVILEEPEGTSGKKTRFANRPMGRYLMYHAQRGDAIVVTKVDRMARSLIDLRFTMDYFSGKGVRIIILNAFGGEALDMGNTTHKLILNILGLLAEWEADIISQRTREAMQMRKRNGLCYNQSRWHLVRVDEAGRKRLEWDGALLEQILELARHLAEGQTMRWLLWHCEEKQWVDGRGRFWWKAPERTAKMRRSIDETNYLSRYMLAAKRLAAKGELPAEYQSRWPKSLMPCEIIRRKKRTKVAQAMPSEFDMETWSADEYRQWMAANKQRLTTAFAGP